MPRTESNLFADNSQNRKFYYRNGLPGRISFPDRHSARRSPPAGVRSGPQGRHATALKGGSSREPTCLEQIGSAMSKGNLAHHHTCPAFCPRYTTSIIKCRPIGCCSHRKAVERRNHKALMAVTACCPLSGRALISL